MRMHCPGRGVAELGFCCCSWKLPVLCSLENSLGSSFSCIPTELIKAGVVLANADCAFKLPAC